MSGTPVIEVQGIFGPLLVVILPVSLCFVGVIPTRPFAYASLFLALWNSFSHRTLQVDAPGHASLLLGALLARSMVYILSFIQDVDFTPGTPSECLCDVMDHTSKNLSEVFQWFYSKWLYSLEFRKIICSELRSDLSKQAFKLRLYDLQLGDLRHFSLNALQVRSVELDPDTKRLKALLMDFKLEVTKLEGAVTLHVGRAPYPHFYTAFQAFPVYELCTRSSVKGTHRIVQGAIKRLVQTALKKTAILPKFRPIYVSPLGNFKLIPIGSPLGWSQDMTNSSLEVTVGRCTGVKLPPQSKLQVLLQLSSAPLFNLDQAVFRPPICFDLKAHISESAPFGIVLGTSQGADGGEVEVLKIARGSRFEDILEPGDHVQVVNGKVVSSAEEVHGVLHTAIGTAQIEVLRRPAFSWSFKKKKMLPKDAKLKLHKDLYYSEDFDTWEDCTSEGCKPIPLKWAERTLHENGKRPHKTSATSTMAFFETFKVDLSKMFPVMNVAVFSISQKSESELLSFAAIPISIVLTNCCKMLSGRTALIVPLLNPHVACWSFKPQAEVEKMFGNSEFDPRHCHGEIEMFFKWKAVAE